MFIAHTLGKFEHEVAQLTMEEIGRWVAYFEIYEEEQKKAVKRAQAKARASRRGRSTRRR